MSDLSRYTWKASGSPKENINSLFTFFFTIRQVKKKSENISRHVRIPSAPAIYFKPPYRSSVRTKCIVENFTEQYRLDWLALGLAWERFPFTWQVHLSAYVHQNLSHHNSTTGMAVTHRLLVTHRRVIRSPEIWFRPPLSTCDVSRSDYRASLSSYFMLSQWYLLQMITDA